MITVEEMRKLLFDEFGISSDEELDAALRKLGGIKIGIFVDDPKNCEAVGNEDALAYA